jgi:hypothetical protein
MTFRPDILVTSPNDPRMALVVEVKIRIVNLDRTEAELKQYMVQMQCPVGLLVTPERLLLYRDAYTARAPQSIQRVGDFNAAPLWDQPPPAQPEQFERFVQDWLENLPQTTPTSVPSDLRDALREYILPAIATGDVRAAHPRLMTR